jgi:hypothetical protein
VRLEVATRKKISLKGVRSVNRADVSASAAVDAFVGIDDVDGITFSDRLSRAFRRASAASDAVIVDYISHDMNSSLHKIVSIYRKL